MKYVWVDFVILYLWLVNVSKNMSWIGIRVFVVNILIINRSFFWSKLVGVIDFFKEELGIWFFINVLLIILILK